MTELGIEVAKQVPALVVLAWIVRAFLVHMAKIARTFVAHLAQSEIENREVATDCRKAIDRNSAILGGVSEVIRRCSR